MQTEESESPREVNQRHPRGSQENREESSKATPTRKLGARRMLEHGTLEHAGAEAGSTKEWRLMPAFAETYNEPV